MSLLADRVGSATRMNDVFGETPERVSPEREAEASFDARVASVWIFLIKLARNYHGRLSDAERAGTEIDDLLADLWITLREKDEMWNPSRGRFITFAGAIARRRLSDLRDQSRLVRSPNNCLSKIREYKAEGGTDSPRKRATFAAIMATRAEFAEVSEFSVVDGEHDSDSRYPLEGDAKDLVLRAVAKLNPYQAAALGQTAGLFGGRRASLAVVAKRLGVSKDRVRRLAIEAREAIRVALAAKLDSECSHGD